MAMTAGITFGTILAAIALLGAYFIQQSAWFTSDHNRLDLILSGLLRAEKRLEVPKARVALGFGGCEDLMVNAMDLLSTVDLHAPNVPKHHDSVATLEELSELLAYFFQHGAAAERYVSNDTLFSILTKASTSLSKTKSFLGGNAPVMARRMANEGAEILLAARFTKELRETLPESVQVVGGDLEENDIHILLEYHTGDQWGKYTAPRANRLIVHSDDSNPYLETLELLEKKMETFQPHALVIGGLQMMDNFPFKEGFRLERLTKLRDLLSATPKKTSIHFELASFTDEKLLQEIIDNVVYYSDSLGMNEQELPNLVSMLTYGNISLVTDAYPRIAPVLDQMRFVYNTLRKTKTADGKRQLTRLHVHTLAYQAILTTKGSTWKNTMHAAAKASLTAHRHVCGSKYIHKSKTKLIMDDSFTTSKSHAKQRILVEENRPVSCWEEEDFEVCLAPGLVCTEVVQTAGGGDNISSAGLLVQVQ